MLQGRRRTARHQERSERQQARREGGESSAAKRIFGPMVDAGASAYADESLEGRQRILAKLRRALRAERRRALAGHWSYDLNRHLGLLSAYKGELGALRARRRETQPACARRDKGFDCG